MGPRLCYAISEATVPKITIYIRNCSNYGDLAFGNEQLGCDIAFAWPTCQIGKITDFAQFYTKGLDMDKMRAAVEKYNTIYNAANRLLFSDIIDPVTAGQLFSRL
jgi:acetyl-CoA carboxylase carboxyltransferase component